MKYFLWFLGFFVLFFGKIECYGSEGHKNVGNLYATSAVLMDGDSGRVLYEKNGQDFMANASTTKIMTCILALENAGLEDVVEVSSYAASMPDVQLHIKEGERYRLRDLLHSMMLESHNDVAVAVAEHISGSCEEFAKLMNKKAREIGCKNTFFITPNGLDANIIGKEDEKGRFHGTTAQDLALIMHYCIQKSPKSREFITITSTPSYSFTDLEGKRNFFCSNHNSLFNLMEGVISGKTGFTGKAGYCYVGAIKQEGKNYIVALLACGWPGNKNYKWKDCKTLVDYGVKEYNLVNIEDVWDEYKDDLKIQVLNAKREQIKDVVWANVKWEGEKIQKILLRPEEKITVKINKSQWKAPVKEGQIVGEYLIMIDENVWKKDKLVCEEWIEKLDFECCIKMVLQEIME